MKQAINKKIITAVLTTLFVIGFGQFSSAQIKSEKNLEFKSTDSISGHPVFRLKMANEEQNEFLVTVLDENGITLYHEVLKGKNISRRYLLNMEETDVNNIRFEIVNLKTHETQAYSIKHNSSVVENLVVTRL